MASDAQVTVKARSYGHAYRNAPKQTMRTAVFRQFIRWASTLPSDQKGIAVPEFDRVRNSDTA